MRAAETAWITRPPGMRSEIFPIINLGANCEGQTEKNLVSQNTMVLGACQVVSLYSLNSLDGFKSASKEIKDLELDVTEFDARQRKFHNPLLMQCSACYFVDKEGWLATTKTWLHLSTCEGPPLQRLTKLDQGASSIHSPFDVHWARVDVGDGGTSRPCSS